MENNNIEFISTIFRFDNISDADLIYEIENEFEEEYFPYLRIISNYYFNNPFICVIEYDPGEKAPFDRFVYNFKEVGNGIYFTDNLIGFDNRTCSNAILIIDGLNSYIRFIKISNSVKSLRKTDVLKIVNQCKKI